LLVIAKDGSQGERVHPMLAAAAPGVKLQTFSIATRGSGLTIETGAESAIRINRGQASSPTLQEPRRRLIRASDA
jgi:hypothetical protein